MRELANLLCGDQEGEGLADVALNQLSRSIDTFSARLISFLEEGREEDAAIYGAFCSRVVLENGCAAILGRLDTFRMLYISEFQAQPSYEIGKRAKSAFSWASDVIGEEGPTMWNADQEAAKISRALFSKYVSHVFWIPALERAQDYIGSTSASGADDVLALDPQSFTATVRGRSSQLHSSLSKGVHWEFFSTSLMFDLETTKILIRDTLVLVAQLGLISHFVPTAHASLTAEAALAKYSAIRGVVL